MGTHMKEGTNRLLHTVGKNPSKLVKEETENDGKVATWTDEETEDLGFSDKRSIPLGNYEYAKVSFGIKVGLPSGDVDQEIRDISHRRMVDATMEVLAREESVIRGNKREHNRIDLNGIGVKVSIWLGYSLTIKKGNEGTHSPEMFSTRILSDGSDFEEQVVVLSKEVGERIGAYKEEILNPDNGF